MSKEVFDNKCRLFSKYIFSSNWLVRGSILSTFFEPTCLWPNLSFFITCQSSLTNPQGLGRVTKLVRYVWVRGVMITETIIMYFTNNKESLVVQDNLRKKQSYVKHLRWILLFSLFHRILFFPYKFLRHRKGFSDVTVSYFEIAATKVHKSKGRTLFVVYV